MTCEGALLGRPSTSRVAEPMLSGSLKQNTETHTASGWHRECRGHSGCPEVCQADSAIRSQEFDPGWLKTDSAFRPAQVGKMRPRIVGMQRVPLSAMGWPISLSHCCPGWLRLLLSCATLGRLALTGTVVEEGSLGAREEGVREAPPLALRASMRVAAVRGGGLQGSWLCWQRASRAPSGLVPRASAGLQRHSFLGAAYVARGSRLPSISPACGFGFTHPPPRGTGVPQPGHV